MNSFQIQNTKYIACISNTYLKYLYLKYFKTPGFPLSRQGDNTVRSGLNGVIRPTAPANAAVSGVRSNVAGSSMSVCMVRVRGANDDTTTRT